MGRGVVPREPVADFGPAARSSSLCALFPLVFVALSLRRLTVGLQVADSLVMKPRSGLLDGNVRGGGDRTGREEKAEQMLPVLMTYANRCERPQPSSGGDSHRDAHRGRQVFRWRALGGSSAATITPPRLSSFLGERVGESLMTARHARAWPAQESHRRTPRVYGARAPDSSKAKGRTADPHWGFTPWVEISSAPLGRNREARRRQVGNACYWSTR